MFFELGPNSSCPELGRELVLNSTWAQTDRIKRPIWPNEVGLRPRSNLVGSGHKFAASAQHRPYSAHLGSSPGHVCTMSVDVSPTSAPNLWNLVYSKRCLAEFDRSCPKSRPALNNLRQRSPKFDRLRPRFDNFGGDFDRSWPESGKTSVWLPRSCTSLTPERSSRNATLRAHFDATRDALCKELP